jgi:transcriptional regulator with XRE-family HTH domain
MSSVNPFRVLRDDLGVTQRVIAQRADKTIGAISNWENDSSYPSLTDVNVLATAYQKPRSVIEKAIIEAARRVQRQTAGAK